MRMVRIVACLAVAVWLAPSPAAAQKSADTLRIAWRDAVPDVTPYYNSLRTGLIVSHQVWDGLVYRDPDTFQIKPALATSWKQVDDTTIDFTLREGVKFHNGDPFSADDVVYTINSILTDKQVSVPSNYLYLAGAEKLDDTHVRIKLKRVFPAAYEYLAMTLPILPQAYREKIGHDAYSKAPVGTGPYRIAKLDGVSEIDLERWDGYYADSPKGKPAIAHVVIKQVADASTELTLLLGGQVDWIWQFNPDQFDNITRVPTLQALRAESMRIGYLTLDAAGRTGADNPLTKVKVRQAIATAIDRATIAKQLMQGGSRPLDAPCYPTQFGCDSTVAVRYPYDPVKAKQLLAEAGYPDGFKTELVTYLLPQYGGAIQNYLKAIGIDAHVSQLQVAASVQRANDGTVPIGLGTWGSYSINDVSAILPYFFDGGSQDYARDPEVTALVAEGGNQTDADTRRKAYSAAIKLITERALFVPLMTSVTTYAISRQLNFKPFPDELPRFYLASWK